MAQNVALNQTARAPTTHATLPFLLRLLQRIDFPHKLGLCERLFGDDLTAMGICWVETAAGIPWKLDLRNATHRWIAYGKYEGAPFLNWAKDFLPHNGIIVDSGANIGQMLLYLAQWVPAGRVLAIEPGRHQADWLQECLQVNKQLAVELVRVGIGSAAMKAYLEETGPADRHGSWSRVSERHGEPIDIIPLEFLLHDREISRVDLWKLDLEGFEIPALQGAGELLNKHHVDAIYVELRGENGRAIRDFLESIGYRCHIFSSKGQLIVPHTLPEDTNGLFLSSKTAN